MLQKLKIQMSEIRYRITSVSSEHPKYPASNLALNQQGWQSGISCVYPQQLTIQFYLPIRTKQLHLLFHQYKIPQLVEVFVKLGSRAHYRKLGHVFPNDNSQSSFEEKEEKTLYFQFQCTHIRLLFFENYKNDMNILDQVALQDLIVVGYVLTKKQLEGVDLTEEESSEDQATESIQISHNERTVEKAQPRQQTASNASSPLFRDIYQKLTFSKEEAVAREQYQKASQIKNTLQNFKKLQADINRLQREKMDALKREDYDQCHKIKNQIIKKKEVVQIQKETLFKSQDIFYEQNTFSRVVEKEISPIKAPKSKDNIKDVSQFKSPQTDRLDVPQKLPMNPSSHDDQILPALLKGKQKYELPLQTSQKRKDLFVDINQSVIHEKQQGEQQYTSLRKDINEIRELTERQEGVQTSMVNESVIKIEPLEVKLRMRVENYFDFLPQKWWQLCQNKNWKGKYQSLKFLKEKISKIQTKQHFMGVLEMLSRIIVSKQAVISIQVLQLLNKMTEIPLQFTLQHLPFFVEDIIAALLNFLNDTNSKIKELAYVTYLNFPRISFLNISVIIRQLIRHKSKVKNDPKLIITKLQLMTMILEKYRQADYNFKEIMSWTLGYLEDPNHKVRSTASELLIALAYCIGSERLLKAIEDLKKPDLLEMVLNMINTSFENSKANIDQSKLSIGESKLNQQFYGPQVGKPDQNKSPAKVPPIQPIYVLSQSKERMEQSKNSKRESDNGNFQLSYSRQSMYEESLEPNQANLMKKYEQQQNQIQVLQDDPDDNVCTYCLEQYEDEKTHYLEECKVLVHCQKCNSLVYIREFIAHLLGECEEAHMCRACKKCGLVFELGQINEHIAKDTCKKKLGPNWERCQFCSRDVFGEDRFWIEHALNCPSLPERKYSRDDHNEEEDISIEESH